MKKAKNSNRGEREAPGIHEAPSSRAPYPSGDSKSSRQESFGARVSRRAADRLRAGHVWVYASDVESVELGGKAGGDEVPSLLPVADYRGMLL